VKIPPRTPLLVSLQWNDAVVKPVGRLATRNRQIFFEYDPSFITRPLPISPFHLPLATHVLGPFNTPFEGLPGVFNDSLPDGWGRLLVDRRARKLGVALTPLDRLAVVGTRGIGALIYQPETALEDVRGVLDLDALAADAAATLEGDARDVLDQLIVLGGSPQGARPKAMIGWSERRNSVVHGARILPPGYRRFLVKFPASDDPKDIGPIEYAYSLMASAAGVRTPRTHLFPSHRGSGFFGAERFDFHGVDRRHVHTVSGLLSLDHRVPTLDYTSVLAATWQLTRDHREVLAMFRLMTFNVLAHNRDDHSKQFSFLMDANGTWAASPAYDLTFSEGLNGEHTTTIDGEGRAPTDADMMRVAHKAGIKERDAARIIDEVGTAVGKWTSFASKAGVTRKLTKQISQRLRRSPP
jgi:serine/threonine-protein kinase HipA